MKRMIVNMSGRHKGSGTGSSAPSSSSGAPAAPGPSRVSPPSSPTSKRGSSAASADASASDSARGTATKSKYDSKCFGLVGKFRQMALIDKALVVAVIFFICAEIVNQIKEYRAKKAAESGSDAAAASAASKSMPLWLIRTIFGIACLLLAASVAFCCYKCNKSRKARSATSHLRTRGRSAPGDAAEGCCSVVTGLWKRLGLFDKMLVLILVAFGSMDLYMTAKEHDVPAKLAKVPQKTIHMLRGTPAPTFAPTPVPPPPPEDPTGVVAEMEARAGDAKFAKPAQCTEDEYTKIRSSGMVGDECRGKPYTQACATSQKTKDHKATWLTSEFAEEIATSHKSDVNGTLSFLGVMLGNAFSEECGKADEHLNNFAQGATEMLASPKLLCNSNFYVADAVKKKWGIIDTGSGSTEMVSDGEGGGKTLDVFIRDANLSREIKDVVHVAGAFKAMDGSGTVTFARTRYLEFQYDWQGAWGGSMNLKDVVDKLDSVGHTCYWPGDGKLWRITNCWQDFYGYKTYAYVACVNRNLAPKLHEKMEALFKTTIGA